MLKRFSLLFILTFCCLTFYFSGCLVFAEAPATLALEQALGNAMLHNPKIKAAQAKLGVSDAELITAGTRLNPSIVSDNGIAEKTYRLGIMQVVELGGKRKRRVALSKAQREVVLAEIGKDLLDIRNEVRKAYVALYNAQEQKKTHQNALAITKELLDIARKREEAGEISKLDVLQAEIANVNTDNELQTNIIEMQQARGQLSVLMNRQVAPDTVLALPDKIPAVPGFQDMDTLSGANAQEVDARLAQLYGQAFENRPEIRQAQKNIDVAKAQQVVALANRIPNLSLTAGPDLVAEASQPEFNAFIMGTMEIPLFDRQQGPIAEAKAKQVQMLQELEVAKNSVRLEVNNAYTAYLLNRQRIQRYEKELLPSASEVTEKSRQAFAEGKASMLTPIAAQRAFINTQLAYLQALKDYQNAVSDLERAVGTGL